MPARPGPRPSGRAGPALIPDRSGHHIRRPVPAVDDYWPFGGTLLERQCLRRRGRVVLIVVIPEHVYAVEIADVEVIEGELPMDLCP